MKKSKFLIVVYALTFMFVLAGSTFAYFTMDANSNIGAVAAGSDKVGISLFIDPLYARDYLIPTNDEDIIVAYENECIDIHGFSACQAYTITVENIGKTLDYFGTIEFSLDEVTHLNYLVLDENDEVYFAKTTIDGTEQSLGNEFTLNEGETRVFKLLIWVPNYQYNQNDDDGDGRFRAVVTYMSNGNYMITGTISNG